MTTCPRCRSDRLTTTLTPHLTHHARLDCQDCGHFLQWLPRPQPVSGEVPADVLALIHPRTRSAPLCGSQAQCRYARALRSKAIHSFSRSGRADLVALMRCVVDASWFIANTGKPFRAIRWPSPRQMEVADPIGECPNCGDPIYSARYCSEECADEFANGQAIENLSSR